MAELQELTHQYVSCADPTESEARGQRVMQCEEQSLMAETAASIIASASARANKQSRGSPATQPSPSQAQRVPSPARHPIVQATSRPVNIPRRTPARRRPGSSPRFFVGAGSTHHLISRSQAQSNRQGFPFASPIQPRAPTRHVSTTRGSRATSPAESRAPPQDFHGGPRPLP